MSLLGSISCFAIGTDAELSVQSKVLQDRFTHSNSRLLNGKVVEGGNQPLPDRHRSADLRLRHL